MADSRVQGVYSGVQDVLASVVWHSLAQYRSDDAVFLAERLYAEAGTEDAAHLLATCYYHSGRKQQAKHLLGSSSVTQHNTASDLLFARCCLDLKDYHAGLARLRGLLCVGSTAEEDIVSKYGDLAAEVFWLMGKLNKALCHQMEAAKYFRLCLKHNPFMWSAYQTLCLMGEPVSPEDCFYATQLPPHLRTAANVHPRPKITTAELASETKRLSLVSPADKNCLMTPDLFGKRALGPAKASSTPFNHAVSMIGGGGDLGRRATILSPPNQFNQFHPDSGLNAVGGPGMTEEVFSDTPNQALTFSSLTPSSNKNYFHSKAPQSRGKLRPPSIARFSQHAAETPNIPHQPQHVTFPDLSTPPSDDPPQPQSQELFQNPSLEMPPPSSVPRLRRSARLGGGGGGGGGEGRSDSGGGKQTNRRTPVSSQVVARKRPRLKSPLGKGSGLKTTIKKQRVTFSSSMASSKTGSPCRKLLPLNQSPAQPQPQTPPQGQGTENVPLHNSSGNHKQDSHVMDTSEVKINEREALLSATNHTLSLLRLVGVAYKSLCQYELAEALKQFKALPAHHYNTPWVLTNTAHVLLAGEKFKEAAELFEKVHKMDPHRQEGMELYGAVLWHLQKETKLSVLAEDMQSSNKLRPEGLCVLASLMNLYKDHNSAIRFLKRAIQISPEFSYAHSLLGLEYTLTKHYDNALEAFQSAVNIDPRHYNSWYGMAHVYTQQEKLQMAELCSRRALSINKSSTIGRTQLAIVLQHQGRLEEALSSVNLATQINSSNHLPKFHRASILSAMGRHEEALEELEEVTTSLPREPSFYKAMSKVLMKLGRPHEAVLRMAWAMDYASSSGKSVEEWGLPLQPLDSIEGLNDDDFVVHSDDDDNM